MKKSDIAMIIFIASVSVLFAYFVANAIFGGKANNSVKVKTIDPISSQIIQPSTDIFNSTAINPAIPVEIIGTPTQPTGTK
jgi:hypothetical protein